MIKPIEIEDLEIDVEDKLHVIHVGIDVYYDEEDPPSSLCTEDIDYIEIKSIQEGSKFLDLDSMSNEEIIKWEARIATFLEDLGEPFEDYF